MPMSEYTRRLREQVGHALLMAPGAVVLIFDEAGRLLVQHRADDGLWGLPGGAIDPGEVPADAAAREVWEEMRLLVKPVKLHAVYGGPDWHITYPNGDENSMQDYVFVAEVVGGALRLDPAEVRSVRYVTAEEAAALPVSRSDRHLIHDAFRQEPHTIFQPPTWQPPPDGVRHGGISDYLRGLREQVGTTRLLSPASGAIIRDPRGQILLQQRADNGNWNAPGGALDPHESPADGVVREVWEETGLIVEPVRLTGLYGGERLYATYDNGDQIAVYSTVFECRVVGGALALDEIETTDLRYFPPEDVPDLLPARWRFRMIDALNGRDAAAFDPPTWQPPTSGKGPARPVVA